MADGAGRQMQFRSRGLKRIATTCCFEHAQLRRSEVAIALKARSLLQSEGVLTAVVSMSCWELFDEQPEHYRRQVIDRGTVRVAVEAAVRQGWDRYVGEDGGFVGMSGFGASGAED
jgi:transketolase